MDKTLLVALDFGETTDSIMDHAAQLAIGLEAAVHLVHAVEFTPYETDDNVTAMTKMVREIEHQLDQYAARLRSVGAEVDGHQVGIGRAHRIILSIAERHDVCGIVLGAGSKSLAERFIVGTTAESVIRGCDRPVFLHHADDSRGPIKRILCAVDLARSSDDTLLSAIDVARVFNAELDVLHVTPPTQSYPGMPHLTGVIDIYGFGTIGPEQAEPAVPDIPPEENLEHFLGRFDKSGIQVTPLIRSGESAETIRETVAERSADMLVVGSANWDNQHVVLGGTITRLLRHVPCELLLVKHRRPTDD